MLVPADWVTSSAGLAALRAEWEDLARGDPSPFAGPAWFVPWWRAFGAGRGLAVCTVRADGELAGVFPLARQERRLVAMANSETPAFRPLARDAAALHHLCRAVVARGFSLEVPAVPVEERAYGALAAAATATGRLQSAVTQFDAPVTEIAGPFEAYRGPRRSQWRETERRQRKLFREHDAEADLLLRPAEYRELLAEGLALEASGWKGAAGSAIQSSPETAGFYRDLAREAHARGELCVSALRAGGRLVAFDLALLRGGRYHLLKTAYDESLRSLAPGLVLRRMVIERCFQEGLEAHEFLGIDMPWKRLFATAHRRHVRFRAYRPTVAGHVAHAYRVRVRPAARRVRDRMRER